MKLVHQQHAAQCLHTKAAEAKRIYCQELSEHFTTYRPTLPIESRLTDYASSRRWAVRNYTSRFGFKESTLRIWLRDWKSRAYVGY